MTTQRVAYVTSASNPLLVRLRRHARQGNAYRKTGEVVLEGEHLCLAWAERGGVRASHALIAESAWAEGRHAELASTAAAATVVVPDALMAELSTLETSPSLLFVAAWPGVPAVDPDARTVVLDRVQDPGNVGSILRSAAAFGYRQVYALTGTVALWSPKVLRAAMGAHFALKLHESLDDAALAGLTLPLVGTSSHADTAIGDAGSLPEGGCSWLFGNEGAGVREDLVARCERVVRIEQPGGQESLNVAAAAAICLHAALRAAPGRAE